MRLIDKDVLLAEYDRVHVGEPGNARKLIENAPTVEERKKGKWIWHWDKFDIDTANEAECSRCKKISAMPVGYFCKWCGADMRGKENV